MNSLSFLFSSLFSYFFLTIIALCGPAKAETSVSVENGIRTEVVEIKGEFESIKRLRASIGGDVFVLLSECEDISFDVLNTSTSCLREQLAVSKRFCNKKVQLATSFQSILSDENISDVKSKMGGDAAPADAVGQVVLWQIRKSIELSNTQWNTQVDRMRLNSRCLGFSAYRKALKEKYLESTELVKKKVAESLAVIN